MTTTTIEWIRSDDGMPGESWNPIVGCSVKSKGCVNCYAMVIAARLACIGSTKAKYEGTTQRVNGNAVWTGRLNFDEQALLAPHGWKKPRRVFVNSMRDLFHEGISAAWLDRVFAVMRDCPRHTFMVLTKRPEEMRAYLLAKPALRNVWLGVSTEVNRPLKSASRSCWPRLRRSGGSAPSRYWSRCSSTPN